MKNIEESQQHLEQVSPLFQHCLLVYSTWQSATRQLSQKEITSALHNLKMASCSFSTYSNPTVIMVVQLCQIKAEKKRTHSLVLCLLVPFCWLLTKSLINFAWRARLGSRVFCQLLYNKLIWMHMMSWLNDNLHFVFKFRSTLLPNQRKWVGIDEDRRETKRKKKDWCRFMIHKTWSKKKKVTHLKFL